MFFDFNIAYSGGGSVSFQDRAKEAILHLANIGYHLFQTIANIAKAAFLAIACAFTLFQCTQFNENLKLAGREIFSNLICTPLSVLGFFAPLNVTKWKGELKV